MKVEVSNEPITLLQRQTAMLTGDIFKLQSNVTFTTTPDDQPLLHQRNRIPTAARSQLTILTGIFFIFFAHNTLPEIKQIDWLMVDQTGLNSIGER